MVCLKGGMKLVVVDSRTTPARCLSAVAFLLAGVAIPAQANSAAETSAAQPANSTSNQEIVITAEPLFRDVRPERELDQQGIAGYGVSTVDELLGEVAVELGDDAEAPLIMVNGQRVYDLSEIGGLPVEVLRNVQVLPPGSAVRLGGTSGQRVISLTLARKARSATLTVAPKVSTDGDWYAGRGEAILTQVRGDTRLNLALRARGESNMLESERGIIQPDPRLPYAVVGNVVGFPNTSGEIDPLLSAAAGQIVTVTPVPAANNPTLSDFVANANQAAVTDLGEFRTLRPKLRSYDFAGTYATRLAPWLTSNATIRLAHNTSDSERGLAPALFVLAATNPSSPFSRDVGLAYYGSAPLHSAYRHDSGEAILTLNGTFGKWTGNFNARHFQSRDRSRTDRQSTFASIPLDDSIDPFTTDLSGLIPITTNRTSARSTASLAKVSFTGPLLKLPAGDLQATIEGRLAWNSLHSRSTFSFPGNNGDFHRNEQAIRGAIDVPLTSRDNHFLGEIGDLDASAEYSRVHFSDAGSIDHYGLGLTWDPVPMLELHGDIDSTGQPPSIQTLGNPVIVSPQVRVFDPLTGTTVDVVQIIGGNPSLRPERTNVRRVSALLRLVPKLNLQLNAEYTDTDVRHFVSYLPEASAAVMQAFPTRFVRDVNGVLTTIDLRPVNFDSHREKRLRYGFSLNTQLGHRPAIKPGGPVSRSGPRTKLQLTASHSIVFSDKISIRPGLDQVDLLEGGALGLASGRVRHQFDGTAALTSGGTGVRVGVTWRGPSTLESSFGGVTDTLHFSPLLLVNLRAFTEVHRFLPHSEWAKSLRLSLNVLNVFNDRQSVRDSLGNRPLQYQAGYRDPIGRTIEIELRKVF